MPEPTEDDEPILKYDKDFDIFLTMHAFKDAGWLLTVAHQGESFHAQARRHEGPFAGAVISWDYDDSVWATIHALQLLLKIPFYSATNKPKD